MSDNKPELTNQVANRKIAVFIEKEKIHGQVDKEYNAKIAKEINDKNYKKTKTNKKDSSC